MVSFRAYLILTYSIVTAVIIFVVGVILNLSITNFFSEHTKEKLEEDTKYIIAFFTSVYDPELKDFDMFSIHQVGMTFTHRGYIVSLYSIDGKTVWSARSCDMEKCVNTISKIENLMKKHNPKGKLESIQYPLTYMGNRIGWINIETYRPFFYDEIDLKFLETINNFLLIIGFLFIIFFVIVSFFLAGVTSKSILKITNVTKVISNGNFSVRIHDKYRTEELYKLSKSVNELALALENGEEWQKKLTSNVAHELRTPLTTLRANFEAMIDGVLEITKERLNSCYEEIIHLGKLVDGLNVLSILERENLVLDRKEFDLSKLIFSVVDNFVNVAYDKDIKINVDNLDELPIFADYDRLKQVFINIISNSIKYTDKGEINIDVKDLGEEYEIIIADTGIGLDKTELTHIFDRFYRSDKSKNRGGTGIGLTIVYSIITAHKGIVNVTSELGIGTTFTIILPKNLST